MYKPGFFTGFSHFKQQSELETGFLYPFVIYDKSLNQKQGFFTPLVIYYKSLSKKNRVSLPLFVVYHKSRGEKPDFFTRLVICHKVSRETRFLQQFLSFITRVGARNRVSGKQLSQFRNALIPLCCLLIGISHF
jgi:hypothetical protein